MIAAKKAILSMMVLAGPMLACGEAGEQAELEARAKVTRQQAETTALARVPGGEIAEGELEEEDGKLVYSFDIRVAGRSGVEEIWVDAMTGQVISEEHETDAEEAAEGDPDDGEHDGGSGRS
jgi:uncharacterized membrane protein YkoI